MTEKVRLWPLIEAVIFRRTDIIERVGSYELSGDRQSALLKHNGKVISTTVAVVRGSVTGVDRSAIEAIISRLNFPFKYTVQVGRLDTERLLERLRTRRAMREIELSKASQSRRPKDIVRANALRRELELIENDIEGMTTGGVPLKMALMISTSAVSESKFYAEERAKSQIRELAGEFAGLTGSDARILNGTELAEALMADSTMVL